MNERLKLLRKELNYSQEKFGTLIGISKSGVSSIENGQRSVTEQHIRLLTKETLVNEEWLRTGNGEMFVSTSRDEEIANWAGSLFGSNKKDSFAKKFVYMLSQLDAEDWAVLEKMAMTMMEGKEE